jgi:hypothetical protein
MDETFVVRPCGLPYENVKTGGHINRNSSSSSKMLYNGYKFIVYSCYNEKNQQTRLLPPAVLTPEMNFSGIFKQQLIFGTPACVLRLYLSKKANLPKRQGARHDLKTQNNRPVPFLPALLHVHS